MNKLFGFILRQINTVFVLIILFATLFTLDNYIFPIFFIDRLELIPIDPINRFPFLLLSNLKKISILVISITFLFIFRRSILGLVSQTINRFVFLLIIIPNCFISIISKNSITVGTKNGEKLKISVDEFKQGGIIAGAIGTGKTTLRLNIMYQMISNGFSIFDIDYKGDAPRLKKFRLKGYTLIPGINLHFDLFAKPEKISKKEFINYLYSSFLETISDGEISPPQKIILYEAIQKTVMKKGNLQSFYRNLILVGHEQKEIIDNYQKQSSLSLVNKFLWLQNNLGDVFSVSGQSISGELLLRNNIYLDLSVIQYKASLVHLRFLIDILITQIMIEVKNVESFNFGKNKQQINKIIFIDEAHMLIPAQKSDKLSKLEELVATLRFKGLSVIATTTDRNLISKIFQDSSFMAQFRSNNHTRDNLKDILPSNLQNYEFLVKCEKNRYIPTKLSTISFKSKTLSDKDYLEKARKYHISKNQDFVLDKVELNIIILEGIIFDKLFIYPMRLKILEKIERDYIEEIRKLSFITDINSFRNQIYNFMFKITDNRNQIDSDLINRDYIKAVLIELTILLFRNNFLNMQASTVENKLKKQFSAQFQTMFINLVDFIEKIVEMNFTSNIIEV